MKTKAQKLLDSTKYTQYIIQDVVDSMPTHTDTEPIEVFTLSRYISDDDLEKEYATRGLVPVSPFSLIKYIKKNSEHQKYLVTHWKDGNGKWCYAAFDRWDGERSVSVGRNDDGWDDSWWFAGVRTVALTTSAPQTSLDTVSLDLASAIALVKKEGYWVIREY